MRAWRNASKTFPELLKHQTVEERLASIVSIVFFSPSSVSSPQSGWEQVTTIEKTIEVFCKCVMLVGCNKN
jgi:hypothetical protein